MRRGRVEGYNNNNIGTVGTHAHEYSTFML